MNMGTIFSKSNLIAVLIGLATIALVNRVPAVKKLVGGA